MREGRLAASIGCVLLLSLTHRSTAAAPLSLRRNQGGERSSSRALHSSQEAPASVFAQESNLTLREREEREVRFALNSLAQHPERLQALSGNGIHALSLALAKDGNASRNVSSHVVPASLAPHTPDTALAGAGVSLLLTAGKEIAKTPFSFDLSKMHMDQLTPTLGVMALIAIIGAAMFEYWHYRCEHVKPAGDIDCDNGGSENHESRLLHIFSGVWPLVQPYLVSSQRPRYYIATMACLGLWDLFLGVVFTIWMKEFWDIIEHKQGDKFLPIMRDSILLISTWILVVTYKSYVSMMLIIDWRRWMTQWLLGAWLGDKTYYHMQLSPSSASPDNPDQRLQEDVQHFVSSVVQLVEGMARAVGQMISMMPLLLVLSPTYAFGVVYFPGWLLYLALLYSGLGTLAAHMIGGKLVVVNFTKQKYEADFRYHIVQVRDHAESIALYGSEECEQGQMNNKFENIVRVWWLYMLHTKRLGFFTAFYHHSSHTFPYLVLAPNYFRGQITLGTMFMLFTALGSVKGAFDWVIAAYTPLTEFRATTDRLENFRAAITKLEGCSGIKYERSTSKEQPDHVMVAKDINVRLPDSDTASGRVVWQAANLSVRASEFVLLTAPEGSGKSCFFRALAGIWPHASGTVVVRGSTLFVPQKSHIPQGSLKQALAYPDPEDRFSDKEVLDALQAVGLQKTVGNRQLSEEANWALVLSGGEAQRLAIAHAVLRRPHVLFLDEATSAMGDKGSLEIYHLLRQPGTLPDGATVISISHDVENLSRVHDSRYNYDVEQGVWAKM